MSRNKIVNISKYTIIIWLAIFFSPSNWIHSQPTKKTQNKGKKIGKLHLMINLIWEGEHIKPRNLKSIQNFRKKFTQIPIVQLLNPAYFTKANIKKPKKIANEMKSVIQKKDIIGLHLHGWKSLIKASGVSFKRSPTFWGNKLTHIDCSQDCGHEVPISLYSSAELNRILKASKNILSHFGFGTPRIFMAGGWMGAKHVVDAIAQNGFEYDLSPVPTHLLKDQLQYYPLFNWIENLWPQITAFSQPVKIKTDHGDIQQMPNNAATVEYQSTRSFFELYRAYANLLQQNPEQDLYIVGGFYQETAEQQLPRLKMALQKIFSHSSKNNVPLTFFSIKNNGSEKKNYSRLSKRKSKQTARSSIFNNSRERSQPGKAH